MPGNGSARRLSVFASFKEEFSYGHGIGNTHRSFVVTFCGFA